MSRTLPMIIALRGYAEPVSKEPDKPSEPKRKRKALPHPSKLTVVFDTETYIDHTQKLRIGAYQVRNGAALHEHGLFFDESNLSANDMRTLRSYASKHRLMLRSRDDFISKILYRYGYDRGGLIVGLNLPFDLSRLATDIATSHGRDMRGGFSLKLRPEKWYPPILVKHLSSRAAFMRFASSGKQLDGRGMRRRGIKSAAKHGYFQDIKTLAAAQSVPARSLQGLAKTLRTDHQKLGTDGHGGPLTPEYIAYCVNDVQVTWECHQALRAQYSKHSLDTPAHRVYSEASLGKSYLRQMEILPWTKCQPDFPRDLLGIIMSTYYGGRAEIRIRRVPVRVLYSDFRSMYPSVCTLMGLWQFVISEGVDWADCTAEIRNLLSAVWLDDLQNADFWKQLTVLVQVRPDDDILPVRAPYSGNSRTIGLNRLTTADFPVWYTLADCIASAILTGKPPHVLRAIRFSPKEPQDGLKPIQLAGQSGFEIDPLASDFYKRIIELRGQIQRKAKTARGAGDIAEAELLESYAQMLKLLANSTSYGIFAELNVQTYDRPRDVMCYGADGPAFQTSTQSIEEAGTHFHPLIATLITGGARLMLALAERLAGDNGLDWALCDTDSMAIARPFGMEDSHFLARAVAITRWFDRLNPYSDGQPLFKIEEQNLSLDDPNRHEELFALAISAKRYVLFNLDASGEPQHCRQPNASLLQLLRRNRAFLPRIQKPQKNGRIRPTLACDAGVNLSLSDLVRFVGPLHRIACRPIPFLRWFDFVLQPGSDFLRITAKGTNNINVPHGMKVRVTATQDHLDPIASTVAIVLIVKGLRDVANEMDQEPQCLGTNRRGKLTIRDDPCVSFDLRNNAVVTLTVSRRVVCRSR